MNKSLTYTESIVTIKAIKWLAKPTHKKAKRRRTIDLHQARALKGVN